MRRALAAALLVVALSACGEAEEAATAPTTSSSSTLVEDNLPSANTTALPFANTTAPPPLCPASAIEVVVTTDRSTYAPGEEVVMTRKATNHAGHDCKRGESGETDIRNQEGRQVYLTSWITASPPGGFPPWKAGETVTSEVRWNQQSLSADGSRAVPPGTYTVTMSSTSADYKSSKPVTATYAGSASFSIKGP